MAYDEMLALRVRAALGSLPDLEEKKMFGGVAFLLNGNMSCGVHKYNLIVRVGAARYEQALSHPYTRPFDMTGRPMAGWIMVTPQGCEAEHDLKAWIKQGLEFASSLPGK
jgi:TfoX/Sxy family transcriptional regulator of competence genes